MNQLPAETVRLLSSSQGITSIGNVVKELVENSLDAGATNIDIKLENYGFNKIEVRDNGSGIQAGDVPVVAVRHYTSKIASSEDLERLTTYGFRGEALGSICCISEVLITTKTAADDFSTQYTLDSSGHVTSKRPSHLGQGTTVTVLRLFKNLPVRKQFYSTNRKCKEELKKVQDLLTAYGIIKPDLRITLTHNKAVIWQKTRVSDHKMACMSVLGTAVMGSMVPFQYCSEDPEVNLSGFLPKAESDSSLTSLSSSERSFVFINNRPVHQKEILKRMSITGEDISTATENLFHKADGRGGSVLFICCSHLQPRVGGYDGKENSIYVRMTFDGFGKQAVDHTYLHAMYGRELTRQYYSLRHKDCARVYPVLFMNITVPSSAVDVNVTPDKTTVLLHDKEYILLAVENVLKSLYGPLPATVPDESNKPGVPAEDMFVHGPEQTDVVVNEKGTSGNNDLHAHASFLSFSSDVQNCQAGKCTEICLNNQTFCGDNVPSLLDKKKVPKSDAFPGSASNLLCEEEQNGENMTDIPTNIVPMDCQVEKANEHPWSSDNIDEIEKKKETLVPKDLPEISADSWSMGSGFKSHLGDNLEPVKILIPETGGEINGQNEHAAERSSDSQSSAQRTKKGNVISDKFGHVTAYDLISSRIIKKPKSAIGLFTQECRPKLISDNPKTSMEGIQMLIEEQWKNLNEEEKKNYELKAAKDLERYNREVKKAVGQTVPRPAKEAVKQKPRLNCSPSGQQKLDKILHAPAEKKRKAEQPTKVVTVPFSLGSWRQQPQRQGRSHSDEHELLLIRRHSFPDVWIFAAENKLMLLNPHRLEEALLRKRLLMNHKLPAERLEKPIVLTDSLIGGSQYMAALYKMQKDYQSFSGWGYLSDPRLVANGFQIKVIEVSASVLAQDDELCGLDQYMQLAPGRNGNRIQCFLPLLHWHDLNDTLTASEACQSCLEASADAVRAVTACGLKQHTTVGASATESHLEIEGMANCLPYYGICDLKEILNAIVNENAKEVYETRPLKVINYLEGEAVRLARQLPLHLSREDVQNTIYRMKQQLGKENKGCVHGRPFFHHLTDIPEVDKHNSSEIIQ